VPVLPSRVAASNLWRFRHELIDRFQGVFAFLKVTSFAFQGRKELGEHARLKQLEVTEVQRRIFLEQSEDKFGVTLGDDVSNNATERVSDEEGRSADLCFDVGGDVFDMMVDVVRAGVA
jgi:hypothetical protein